MDVVVVGIRFYFFIGKRQREGGLYSELKLVRETEWDNSGLSNFISFHFISFKNFSLLF